MKSIIILSVAGLLVGCAGNGGMRGPTRLNAADAGMWSSKTPDQVRSCIAGVQTNAASTRIGEPLRFQVDSADRRKTRYMTVVSVFGDVSANKQEAEAAASCL